jgi:hypothetical protein
MGDERITVMNLTSRTIVLSSPVGMKEEVLHVGDNRIPRAVWDYSVTCCPSLGRDPKLFVVPEAKPERVERVSEPVVIAIKVDGDIAEIAKAVAGAVSKSTPSLADMSVSQAKRAIEQASDLDALDAWTHDPRKAVSAAAQKRIEALMGGE